MVGKGGGKSGVCRGKAVEWRSYLVKDFMRTLLYFPFNFSGNLNLI